MTDMRKQRSSSLSTLLDQNHGPELKTDSTAQGSPKADPPVMVLRSVLRRILLVFLWLSVISGSFAYIMLTIGESPLRYKMGISLFLAYGFLVAMYAKKLKPLWFFVGGVTAIIVLGGLDGLIRRILHG
jgi:hypothetical protein